MSNIYGNPQDIGGKAESLRLLSKVVNSDRIPTWVVITGEEYRKWESETTVELNLISIIEEWFGIGLVSIRSSPMVSMPGLMQTQLNVIPSLAEIKKYIALVLDSYNSKNAILYRKINKIQDRLPAVIIQKMVHGDSKKNSGSGVWFSRNNLGESVDSFYEYKIGVSGDKVVSNSIDLNEMDELEIKHRKYLYSASLELEKLLRSAVEIEFTIQHSTLYLLQCRALTIPDAIAKSRICMDFNEREWISDTELQYMLESVWKNTTEYQMINPDVIPIGSGVGVSPGICSGVIGEDILYSETINNNLLGRLTTCKGVITKEGGVTAHIAILCRNLGIPYVILPIPNSWIGSNVILDGLHGNIYNNDPEILITINTKNYQKFLLNKKNYV